MLLFFAILFLVCAVLLGLLVAMANGMSDAPGDGISLWWALTLLIPSAACFTGYFLKL